MLCRNLVFALCVGVSGIAMAETPGTVVVVPTPVTRQNLSHEVCKAYCGFAEVNEHRRQRGLRPFIYDPNLSRAAAGCAEFRSKNHIIGHCNDFAALPAGCFAPSAGCGAWTPGTGWGTCCSDDNWTYAGAAYAIGSDGKCYMHLFVR